jgi:hypothetical protein
MEKMQVRIIIEILGRPPSNVTEAMNGLVKRLGTEKGVTIQEQTIHPPVKVKDSKDLYTTFAEITLEMDSLPVFFSIVFAYMPSHIELIHPETLELRNEDLTAAANAIVMRLHSYDEIAKRLIVDRENLAKKLYEYAPHLFKKKEGQQGQTQPAAPVVVQEQKKKSGKKKGEKKKFK